MAKTTQWVMLLSASIGAALLFGARGGVPRAGNDIEVPITLVQTDEGSLHCASYDSADGSRCEDRDPDVSASPPVSPRDTLIPVVTTEGTLFLVDRLFEQELVKRHLASPTRFVVRCRLTLTRQLADFQVRFGSADWRPIDEPTWAAHVESCRSP